MKSKRPPFRPASVFTPFFRRFTDEHARELADTLALYREVRRAHASSPWAQSDAIDRLSETVLRDVTSTTDLPKAAVVLDALCKCLKDVLAQETAIFCFPHEVNLSVLSLRERVDLRRFLRAQQHFLANEDRVVDMLAGAVSAVLAGIVDALPTFPETAAGTSFSVPLMTLLSDPGGTVDRIIGTLGLQEHADAGLFAELRQRFWENVCRASGVLPDQEPRKPLVTADTSKLPPVELAETYLQGTPFLNLFLCSVPFSLPLAARFEHMHIVAGTGHGKTQTLQHLIAHDLAQEPESVPAVVIVDSQGDMLAKIARLELFHPEHGALRDRLVIIDPTDVEHPPALGLFDINLARVRGYDARYREQIMNGVIELYDYIFGGLIGAELTQKQSVIFRYLARLMLAIPDATILTLKDVMQDATPFVAYFDRLDGTARDFFQHEFNDRQFAETKKQILRRLWGVLENPTFERLFSQPRNRLDMFAALNSGKIVLVNTAKDFLKAERSSILGRFFIALTFQAALERAALPETARRPAFLYIDEAADYFDDTIDSLLTQARKFRLGVVFAHQYLDQLPRALEASIMTNSSIKFAGGVSSADAHKLAPNMGTTHDFIARARKRRTETEFAVYIRNSTPSAVTLTVPFGSLERMPTMDSDAIARVAVQNRERYGATRPDPPPPAAASPDRQRPAAASPSSEVGSSDDWRS